MHLLMHFWRQGLNMQPSQSQTKLSCYSLPSARITSMYYHAQPLNLILFHDRQHEEYSVYSNKVKQE